MAEDIHSVEDDQVSAGKNLDDVENVDDEEWLEDLWFTEGPPGGFTSTDGFLFRSVDEMLHFYFCL